MTDPISRDPRDADTRDANARTKAWTPPELLPMPDPVPGWVFRWMRASILGETDTLNVGAYRREGWEPVIPSDMPDVAAQAGCSPTDESIEVGGLVLVKIPSAIVKQRDQYYRDLSSRQMDSINAQLDAQNDPRMPLFRDARTTRGT